MTAGCVPLLSSVTSCPLSVSKIRMSVPLSEAVARRAPEVLTERQDKLLSWAEMNLEEKET